MVILDRIGLIGSIMFFLFILFNLAYPASELADSATVIEPVWSWETPIVEIGPPPLLVEPATGGDNPYDYLIHCETENGEFTFQIPSVSPEYQEMTLKSPGCFIELLD